jgi:hypothetical protein
MGGFRKTVAMAMAYVMLLLAMPLGGAQAAMVSTEQAVEQSGVAGDRARVLAFVQRDDVRRQMVALGVEPAEAAARAAALSDPKVREIAGQLDRLPAGQSAVGAVVGAALLIFLVLLITDLLGLTDVFPFVNR